MAQRSPDRQPLEGLAAHDPSLAWRRDAVEEVRRRSALSPVGLRSVASADVAVSVRLKDGRWIVEIYESPELPKRYVTQAEIRALGLEPPTTERQARKIERAILQQRDERAEHGDDETIGSFTARWPQEFRRGRNGRQRSDSTVIHANERVRRFGAEFADRTLRSFTRTEARTWANEHPSTVPALRTMFGDAVGDRLADENPFARLGIATRHGRKDIIVLTREEVHDLAALAVAQQGDLFGRELQALILWAAYTCMRPGESFAARYSLLHEDTYDLRRQFNSTLGRETDPKHDSTGLIYVPEPARRAVLDKPRRLDDDLMFRSKRGKQFRQASFWPSWHPLRTAFVAKLPPTHHLRERAELDPRDHLDFYELRHFGASYMLNELELEPWIIAEQLRHSDGGRLVLELYGHPSRSKAIERMRRAYASGSVGLIHPADGSRRGAATRRVK
jgi:integrase